MADRLIYVHKFSSPLNRCSVWKLMLFRGSIYVCVSLHSILNVILCDLVAIKPISGLYVRLVIVPCFFFKRKYSVQINIVYNKNSTQIISETLKIHFNAEQKLKTSTKWKKLTSERPRFPSGFFPVLEFSSHLPPRAESFPLLHPHNYCTANEICTGWCIITVYVVR